MWVELNDEEVATLIAQVDHAEIRRKLEKQADPADQAYSAAAEARSRRISVPLDTAVVRYPGGAYVLSWCWVDNVDAGLPGNESFDDFDISPELEKRLRAIENFSVADFGAGTDGELGYGRIGEKWWRVELSGTYLRFSVFADDASSEPCWTMGAYLLTGGTDASVSAEVGLGFVADVIPRYRVETDGRLSDEMVWENLNYDGRNITSQFLAILCATHVSQKTWNSLKDCSQSAWKIFGGNFGPTGVILYAREPDPRTPSDLKEIFKHAADRGYSWVALHENGETIDGLPVYRS